VLKLDLASPSCATQGDKALQHLLITEEISQKLLCLDRGELLIEPVPRHKKVVISHPPLHKHLLCFFLAEVGKFMVSQELELVRVRVIVKLLNGRGDGRFLGWFVFFNNFHWRKGI
jgi:hypothetical protein